MVGLNVSGSIALWFLIMLSVILSLSHLSLPSDSVIQLICVAKGTGLGLVIKGGANRAEGPMVLIQEIVPGGDCQKVGVLAERCNKEKCCNHLDCATYTSQPLSIY